MSWIDKTYKIRKSNMQSYYSSIYNIYDKC